MIEKVAAALERLCGSGPVRPLGVAVSGGADSVFLLHALHELGRAAAVLHANHKLRGPASDADEEFVRRLGGSLGIPVEVQELPVAPGNLEQEARRARYEFFTARVAAGICDFVATGHTLDDQAETVLYRFVRGSGTAGLSGIRPAVDSLVRPLLGLRREEIREWLQARRIAWREDESNASLEFARNRIRLRHLPELKASLNPALPEVLAATAEWAAGEEKYWAGELARVAPTYLNIGRGVVLIRIGPFLELAVAVQRRLLRFAAEQVRGHLRSLDFRHIEAIRGLMNAPDGSGRLQAPDLDVYRSFDWLRFAQPGHDTRLPRDFESPLAAPGRTTLPERQLTFDTELVSAPDVYNSVLSSIDQGRCATPLILRNWRPGDCYHAVGRRGPEKVKTLFQEYRVPLWERRNWPIIVTEGGAIVWSRRFGVAQEFAAHPESRHVLIIRETAESNYATAPSMELKRVLGAGSRQPADADAVAHRPEGSSCAAETKRSSEL